MDALATTAEATTCEATLALARRESSIRSQRALDALTFCLADVADGLGPFLVIYLTSRRNWSASEAGFAMSAMLLGTVVSQAWVGAWIDRARDKRILISVAAALVAVAIISMYYLPMPAMVYGLQFATGMLVTVFPPAIAAISLGMMGRQGLPARAGRNEALFHAGNVVSAAIAAVLAWQWGSAGVFYGVACMALASAVSVLAIRNSDIDPAMARGADADGGACQIVPLTALFRDHRIAFFAAAVVLFHFANAAMLPLLGQKLAHNRPQSAATLMAACIVVAQLSMVPVALWASRQAAQGRRAVLLTGFAVLPIRGMLYLLTDHPALLIANQVLDGIGAGIFGVVALLVMADLTKGTGRFNFALGVVGTAVGIGAACSNFVTGLIVDAAGFSAGFLFLSLIAVLALAVLYATFGETLPSGSRAKTPVA